MFPGGPQAPLRAASGANYASFADVSGGNLPSNNQPFPSEIDLNDFPSLGGGPISSPGPGGLQSGLQGSGHSNLPKGGPNGSGPPSNPGQQPGQQQQQQQQMGQQMGQQQMGQQQMGQQQMGQQQMGQQQMGQQAMYRNMAMGGVGGGVGGQGLGQKFQMATEDFPALGGGKGGGLVGGQQMGSSNLNNGSLGSHHPVGVGVLGVGSSSPVVTSSSSVAGVGGGVVGVGGVAVGGLIGSGGVGSSVGGLSSSSPPAPDGPGGTGAARAGGSSSQPGLGHSGLNPNPHSAGKSGPSGTPLGLVGSQTNSNNTSNMTGPSQYGNLGGIQGQGGPPPRAGNLPGGYPLAVGGVGPQQHHLGGPGVNVSQ
ncbi:hypothetical protein TrRE_jg7425, partial [Triparma retinervis]